MSRTRTPGHLLMSALSLGSLGGLLTPTPAVAQIPETFHLEVVVIHAETRLPLAGATILGGDPETAAVTDSDGRAILRGLPAGEHHIRVTLLGYETVEVHIHLPRSFPLQVALGVRPVELDGVEAEGRSRSVLEDPATPSRRHVFRGAPLAVAEMRGSSIVDLVNTIPGFRINPSQYDQLIRSGREMQSMVSLPLIILDGARVWDGLRTPLHDVQSLEVLAPREAVFRYGLSAAMGAIEIWTRGKGPFRADGERDCPDCR